MSELQVSMTMHFNFHLDTEVKIVISVFIFQTTTFLLNFGHCLLPSFFLYYKWKIIDASSIIPFSRMIFNSYFNNIDALIFVINFINIQHCGLFLIKKNLIYKKLTEMKRKSLTTLHFEIWTSHTFYL